MSLSFIKNNNELNIQYIEDSAEVETSIEKNLLQPEEARQIGDYIRKHRVEWVSEAQKNPRETVRHLSSKETGLARTLEYNCQTDKVYVLFNKLRLGDEQLGSGSCKKVKTAIEFSTGKRYAYSSSRITDETRDSAEREIRAVQLLKGAEGVVTTDSIGLTQRKEGVMKLSAIQELGEKSLEEAILEESLSPQQKKAISQQLLLVLVQIHNKNLIHRDIKPANLILVWNDEKKDYELRLIDFGTAILDEEREKIDLAGNADLPPEYDLFDEKGVHVISKKHDVYSAGLVLASLWGLNIAALTKRKDPPASSQLKMLVWAMLRSNPEHRLTSQMALEYFQENFDEEDVM